MSFFVSGSVQLYYIKSCHQIALTEVLIQWVFVLIKRRISLSTPNLDTRI